MFDSIIIIVIVIIILIIIIFILIVIIMIITIAIIIIINIIIIVSFIIIIIIIFVIHTKMPADGTSIWQVRNSSPRITLKKCECGSDLRSAEQCLSSSENRA